jgi:hypothetical protein
MPTLYREDSLQRVQKVYLIYLGLTLAKYNLVLSFIDLKSRDYSDTLGSCLWYLILPSRKASPSSSVSAPTTRTRKHDEHALPYLFASSPFPSRSLPDPLS